jgi:hypothetical protein
MSKVRSLQRPETFILPIGGAGSVRLTGFRDAPKILLELRGPHGGDLGALLLPKSVAQLLAEGLTRVADGGSHDDVTAPRVSTGDARTLLTTSLDRDTTLASFARLAVPVFADWCSIDVRDGANPPRRLTIVHADAGKAKAARTLARYPHDPQQEHPRSMVWRTGRPDIALDVPDERLAAAARSKAHLEVLRALRCRSSVAVPMIVAGRVTGVITFTVAESGRRYSDTDLPTALMLAQCARLSAENAHLYDVAHTSLRGRVGTSPGRATRPRGPATTGNA